MNIDWIAAVMADPSITATTKNVAFALAARANEDGISVASREALAKAGGCSVGSVTRATKALLKSGCVLGCELNGLPAVKLEPAGCKMKLESTKLTPQQKVSPLPLPLASPSPSPLPKVVTSMNKQESNTKNKKDKSLKSSNSTPGWLLAKSHRFNEVWALMQDVQFVTKDGTMEAVSDNVANPEVLCTCLSAREYSTVDAGAEFRAAAAWTAERKKNRRDKLGMYLRNWFKRAAETRAKTDGSCTPRFLEPM